MSNDRPVTEIEAGVFVGREVELRKLRNAFDSAASGAGSLAMVVGEPGIGKTTLCQQLAAHAEQQDGMTLVGHCYEEGSLSLPYLAFVEAMRSYVLARNNDDLKAELGPTAADLARIVPEIPERLQVQPTPPSDPEADRYRLFHSVGTFLRNASAVQPLLVVLEDLHDADTGTLDLLTYLSRSFGDSRLLIVGTYRDVEVDRAHPLSGTLAELRRVSSFERLLLRGLNPDEVQRMMAEMAGREVPWLMSEEVHRQTEGNPLFVQEVLRYLVEEGILAPEDEGSTRQTPPEMRIPEGLRDVIGKRLSRLSQECNNVLSLAAVIGREFPVDVLQKVAGLAEDDLFTALEEAKGAAVVEERSAVGAVVSFRFTHAFFRQTLYEETIAPRRIRVHQQVARALEEHYEARPEEHAVELAEHFSYSSDESDLVKAIHFGELAANRAMAVYAYTEAVGHLERALEVEDVVDSSDKAKRCDLLLALGEVLMPAGESLRAYEDVAPEAFGLAESLDDNDRVSRICELAVDAAQRASGGSLAQEPEFLIWAERFDRSAAPGTRNRTLADLAMSIFLSRSGDFSGTWTLRQRALKLAQQLSDHEVFLQAAGNIIRGPWAPQHQEERLALAREVGDRYRDSLWTPLSIMGPPLPYWLAWAYLEMGERDRAEELWGELKERATRTQDANLLMMALRTEVMVATLDGRLEDAVATAERLEDRGEELGIPMVGRMLELAGSFYPSLYLGGRTEHPLASYEEWAQALILAHAGRAGEALELSRRNMKERADGENTGETPSAWLLYGLNTAVLVGDRETAEVLYPMLIPLGDIALLGFNPMKDFSCISRLLGGAAALLGDPQSARMHYDKALELMGKIRFRPEVVLAHLELAELLLDHYPEERTEALEHLDFAITELRDMKMQPALERALELQAGLEAKAVEKPAYPDGLSLREVEVLRLIIAGATNQDIADALFITTNTVANHVKNILSKSNTDNRTAAATYGVRHGLAED